MERPRGMLAVALVFARVVLEPASPSPQLSDDAVLLVQRHGVYAGGCQMPDPDGGLPDGGLPDAATDAALPDAGVPDADPGDAGTTDGMTCETIEGDAISLIVRPTFAADPEGSRFALLFVTPSRPIVETVADPFPALAALTAARTEIHVTEVEDPALGSRCEVGGGGCGFSPQTPPTFVPPDLGDAGLGDGGVGVETVGPYEIVRVQPADTAALAGLLDSFGYLYQQDDLDAVAPYLERGFTVVAVRVAIPSQDGAGPRAGTLAPLQLTWAGSELRLPAALGATGADGVTAYIAGDGRFEFPGATVRYARRTFSDFSLLQPASSTFVTRNELIDTVPASPDEDPIAEAIPGDPEFQEVTVVEQTERVPVTDCGLDIGCGCGECNAQGAIPSNLGIGFVVVFVLRPRRRRRRA